MGPGYSQNLEAQPDNFMGDDDSDDDVGSKPHLNYDSDDKESDLIGSGTSGTEGGSELITLDSEGSGGAAKNIPKLQGPK